MAAGFDWHLLNAKETLSYGGSLALVIISLRGSNHLHQRATKAKFLFAGSEFLSAEPMISKPVAGLLSEPLPINPLRILGILIGAFVDISTLSDIAGG